VRAPGPDRAATAERATSTFAIERPPRRPGPDGSYWCRGATISARLQPRVLAGQSGKHCGATNEGCKNRRSLRFRTRPHGRIGLAPVKGAPSGQPSAGPDGPPWTGASSDALPQRGPASAILPSALTPLRTSTSRGIHSTHSVLPDQPAWTSMGRVFRASLTSQTDETIRGRGLLWDVLCESYNMSRDVPRIPGAQARAARTSPWSRDWDRPCRSVPACSQRALTSVSIRGARGPRLRPA